MKKIIVFILWAAGAPLLQAAFVQNREPALTLEQCLQAALASHPLLRAAAYDITAADARIRQAKALSQPSLGVDIDLQPQFLDFKGSGESYVGVSQALDFPGKRSLRGKIAGQEADAVRADTDLLRLDIRFQVQEAFYQFLLAQEMLRYAEQDRDLSRDFLQRATIKFEAGDIAEMEVVRARVEAAKASNTVRVAENALRLACARLNVALSRKPTNPLEIVGAFQKEGPLKTASELTDLALEARPELRRLRHEIESERLREKLAYLNYLPDPVIGVSRHWLAGEATTWDLTFSLPVPLFFWQPKSGEIAEARAAHRGLEERANALIPQISLEVESSHAEARNAAAQIVLFEKEILAQAEDAYEKFLFSYQQGEIGGIELIEARRTLLDARRSYAEVLYTFNVALAALEKSVGAPWENKTHE